jgi:PAS domain S-box-containing protein
MAAMIQASIAASAPNCPGVSVVCRFRHKQGHYVWLEVIGRVIRSEETGEIEGFISSSRDVSARKEADVALKESEEKYRWLIETMQGGLTIYDEDNNIAYVNDRFCELLGYSRDELIGTKPYEYLDDINAQKIDTQLARRHQAESSSYEVVAKRKNGRLINLLVSGAPLLHKNGAYAGSFAVTTDITIQKQAEDALQQALAQEKDLSELKSRFVSMASHEFRAPLATILALIETLIAYRHKLPEDQIQDRFDKIKTQISRLKDIMEDVLLLARMQACRMEFNPVQLDLDELCRSVLDEFQSQPKEIHHIGYTCYAMPRELALDKKLMRQIINNLISNAIKYSPHKKSIQVNLDYTNEALVLSVSDQGIGIPEADLPHLFEPFHRATNVDSISGTGLGLVIIKESVELHGGTISVDSLIDVGTTFTVRIPIPA